MDVKPGSVSPDKAEIFNVLKSIGEILNECMQDEGFSRSGLSGGKAGILLFMFYYERYFDGEKENAPGYLDAILDNVQSNINNAFSFANGLAGIGWLIEHLVEKEFIAKNYRLVLEDLDVELEPVMYDELNRGNYDFLHGALGCLFYYVKRKSNKKANKERILQFCRDLKRHGKYEIENQVYWERFGIKDNGKKPGDYDLGLSHGIPSITSVLVKIYLMGHKEPLIEDMITGSISFILSNRNAKPGLSLYPSLKSSRDYPSRLAWCYGDLGIALLLLNAGRALNKAEWIDESNNILSYSLTRKSPVENLVFDSCLCHGSGGLVHIYNRFFNIDHSPQLEETVSYWCQKTLEFRIFEDGLAGFKFFDLNRYINNYGLLEGVSGIGLSFISFLSGVRGSFDWDECLLIS
jgi:lantibiotic biosynthesis protein